ncbi:MAG: hypothetical protein NC314_03270 [Roseburia sp.]|nr:hypothetical protein [Roseburia sp.]
MSNKVNYLAKLYQLERIEAEDIYISKDFVYQINGEDYKDPDGHSQNLYKRWHDFLIHKIPDGRFQIGKNGLEIRAEINGKTFLLSSDYIGPSKYYAAKTFRNNEKDEREEMAEIFNICRCFEGHIIWPKGQMSDHHGAYIPYGPNGENSINMSRGGRSGVFDRFDVTLYLLKRYYELFIEKECFYTRIFDRTEIFLDGCKERLDVKQNAFRLFNIFLSFELSLDWLAVFKEFPAFIQIFELQDFVEDNEPVIWGKTDKIEVDEEYIENCKAAIKRRGGHL